MAKKNDIDAEKLRLDYIFEYGIDFKNRIIRITGSIGPCGQHDSSYCSFDLIDGAMTELEKLSIEEPITVRINSPGGELYEALAIVGRLTSSPCKIITEGYGHVMSAATLILACGNVRKISKFCITMFHQSSYGLSGSHEQVKQEVEQMEKEEKLWAKWISSMSTKSEGFWYTVVQKKNVYLVADKLLAYGVVDEIL
jgi:ATP-dependent protease ClpP protease subunit